MWHAFKLMFGLMLGMMAAYVAFVVLGGLMLVALTKVM